MKLLAIALDYDGTIARDNRLDDRVRAAIGEFCSLLSNLFRKDGIGSDVAHTSGPRKSNATVDLNSAVMGPAVASR